MSCTGTPCTSDCTCGCCSGISVATPAGQKNLPGLSAITYRTGTWATFRESIPAGTQVQSVPAQNQTPQYFETFADIRAKADWNALPITTGIPWTPPGANGVYLVGTATQLNPGDSLLILGIDREEWTPTTTPNEQWDVVTLNQVIVDKQNNLTWVGWDTRLTHKT